MDNGRSFIRHEILNIVTLVNFLIMDTDLSAEKKNELLEHLKMIGLLCAEQEFLLGKSKKFFDQKVPLHEIIEIIGHILEKHAKSKNVVLSLEGTQMMVKGDGNAIKNGIEQILLNLMELSKNIQLCVNEKTQSVEIKYTGNKTLTVGKEVLLEYLKAKHTYPEIFCKIAVEILKVNGVKVEFKKNLITLKFNKG